MGACISRTEDQDKILHREAERQMREAKQKLDTQVKVLLLGPGDSGKSTILKQMRLIHKVRFTTQEIESYRQLVFSNLVHGLAAVLEAMDVFQMKLSESNVEHLHLIDEPANVRNGEMFPSHYYEPLLAIWNDPSVQMAYERGNELALPDNLRYFFTDLSRLFNPTYVPSEQDILRTRARTTGINETKIKLSSQEITLVDVGGQKSERRKWIHCFEDVTTILFLVALSGYDTSLVEDSDANQMNDALAIWDSICHSQWFKKTPLVLFLNKNDLFEQKIKFSDLRNTFPDYDGPVQDAAAGREYFQKRFVRLHAKAKVRDRALYVHTTTATDTALVKVVMSAVEADTLRQNLNKINLL